MTLINFLTRVHFADGVLEEALRSEIEANGKKRPLVIVDDTRIPKLNAERFFSGFPARTDPIIFSDIPRTPTEAAARAIAQTYSQNECDVLVVYGSNWAIDLAKAARVAIAYDDPIDEMSVEEGGARRINGDLPDLFAVPDILGFASAISDYARLTLDGGRQILLSSRNLIPSVTICDPTLTMGTPPKDSAVAAAGVFCRAIDSYMSPRYHPPADGLALDALNRIHLNIGPAISHDCSTARRELMAAGLNSSLSLQKGLCAIHALCNSITSASKAKPNASAVGGVIISHLVEFYEQSIDTEFDQLKRVLRIEEDRSLTQGLRKILGQWPIPQSLSELDVELGSLGTAANIAAKDRAIISGPRNLNKTEIRQLFSRAY